MSPHRLCYFSLSKLLLSSDLLSSEFLLLGLFSSQILLPCHSLLSNKLLLRSHFLLSSKLLFLRHFLLASEFLLS